MKATHVNISVEASDKFHVSVYSGDIKTASYAPGPLDYVLFIARHELVNEDPNKETCLKLRHGQSQAGVSEPCHHPA